MSDFKLGDIVTWNSLQSTIIGIPINGFNKGLILLGWQDNKNGWMLDSDSKDLIGNTNLINNISQYITAYWVPIYEIKLIKSTIKQNHSVQCKRCQNKDFPYAEPNQPDGSFICWSCTKYFFYK